MEEAAEEIKRSEPTFVFPNGGIATNMKELYEGVATISPNMYNLIIGDLGSRAIASVVNLARNVMRNPLAATSYLHIAYDSFQSDFISFISHHADVDPLDLMSQADFIKTFSCFAEEPEGIHIRLAENPRTLEHVLSNTIIGQEEAIKTLATEAFYHYTAAINGVTHKSVTLLAGRTGCGKTYSAEVLAQFLQVPFVKIDATKLTKTGYVGQSSTDFIRELVQQVNNYQHIGLGLVLIDEIDKIADLEHGSIASEGVQQELLSIIEGYIQPLQTQDGVIPFNTSNLMYVLCGSFEKQREIKAGPMGFAREPDKEEILLEWGLTREFRDRIGRIVFLNELSEEDLYEISKLPTGPFNQFRIEMALQGRYVQIYDDAHRAIARHAKNKKVGARALQDTVNAVVDPQRYSVPSSLKKKVTITGNMVNAVHNA